MVVSDIAISHYMVVSDTEISRNMAIYDTGNSHILAMTEILADGRGAAHAGGANEGGVSTS